MKKIYFLFYFLMISVFVSFGQNEPKIEHTEKKLIIDSVCVMLNRTYIFPEVALKMTQLIKKNFEAGNYNSITDPRLFGNKLTEDLLSISKDKHLGIVFSPDRVRFIKSSSNNDKEAIEKEKRVNKIQNYGFSEIKILTGNVGYIKFDGFDGSQEGYEIGSAAMNYLSNTDAIIFDLRENGGGSAEMIQLLISYLYEGAPRHLNSFYHREKNITTQTWTLPYVNGKRNPNCLVYVLTSNNTFSAAEEFTYNLKNMKRATIVGEITGGGAHPVKFKAINDNFFISLPYGKAINPITNTNWEGTGVQPDIATTEEKSFDVAYLNALTKLKDKENNPQFSAIIQWAIDGLQAKVNPIVVSENILKTFVGKYGPRNITLENGSLYYQREGRPKYKMNVIKEDYFDVPEIGYFRLKFIKEGSNIVALEGHYNNGQVDKNEKDK